MSFSYDQVPSDMSNQVCNKLTKEHWRKYDTSSVPEKPGIYAIGQKKSNGETKYLYVGRSNDLKRRLDEHKTPTPQQAIDRRVAGKFKQHKKAELRIKTVPEKRQKTLEGAYIGGITKKYGYRPVLNKRAGDHSSSSTASHTKHTSRSTGSRGRSSGRSASVRSSKVVRSSATRVSVRGRRR